MEPLSLLGATRFFELATAPASVEEPAGGSMSSGSSDRAPSRSRVVAAEVY